MSLVTPAQVRVNAKHLTVRKVSDEELQSVIDDVHILYIADYANKWSGQASTMSKLGVIEKLLSQHMATINVRRADTEIVAGMHKTVTVPKGLDLDQTEYGQLAKRLGKDLGMSWASDDSERGSLVIY